VGAQLLSPAIASRIAKCPASGGKPNWRRPLQRLRQKSAGTPHRADIRRARRGFPQMDPTAKAWAAWLHYGLGSSFQKTSRLLHRLGINLTAGALSQAAQSSATALVPVRERIVAAGNSSAMVVPDETGWRVDGEGAWLWVAATSGATAYWSRTAAASTRPARSSRRRSPASRCETAGLPTAASILRRTRPVCPPSPRQRRTHRRPTPMDTGHGSHSSRVPDRGARCPVRISTTRNNRW
jgi:hypothetical protein